MSEWHYEVYLNGELKWFFATNEDIDTNKLEIKKVKAGMKHKL